RRRARWRLVLRPGSPPGPNCGSTLYQPWQKTQRSDGRAVGALEFPRAQSALSTHVSGKTVGYAIMCSRCAYSLGGRPVPIAITVDQAQIARFCEAHKIRTLALFGSVLRPDFRTESDVDVLVEFEPGHVPGLAFFAMQDELSQI